MKAITLRGVDEELEKALRAKAKELATSSLNSTIIHVLHESLGLTKRRYHATHHDLDHLAGTWSDKDRREFEKATTAFEQIDEDLWR